MHNRLRTLLFIVLQISISQGAEDINASNLLSASDLIKGAVVKASCGQCNFEMKGKGCDLAVLINGKTYFVAETNIDDHGDAHASHGFCNAIRDAQVKGKIKNGKFHAKEFVLLESVK
jgi:bacterioferritin-associated ferredoxin